MIKKRVSEVIFLSGTKEDLHKHICATFQTREAAQLIVRKTGVPQNYELPDSPIKTQLDQWHAKGENLGNVLGTIFFIEVAKTKDVSPNQKRLSDDDLTLSLQSQGVRILRDEYWDEINAFNAKKEDKRYQILCERLRMLPLKGVSQIEKDIDRVCFDTFNYDAATQTYCPIAIGLNLHNTIANPTNENIGEAIGKLFQPVNALKGVEGKFYTTNRKEDLLEVCNEVIFTQNENRPTVSEQRAA